MHKYSANDSNVHHGASQNQEPDSGKAKTKNGAMDFMF